ncbi:MAG: transglycosylase family protein [Actinobacteria bacterium]|nr:transglycosylase family protein [Actinomycetota bacterium]
MHALPLVAVLAIGATAFTVGSGTSDGAETHGAAASPAAVAPSTTISPANEERAKAKALAAVEAVNDRDARVRFMNALAENQAQQQAAAAAAAEAAKAQQEAAAAAAQAQAQAQARAQAAAAAQAAQNQGVHGACGGNLPPCCVMMRESRGNPTAVNASSGASGKWQFMTSTWANYDGYPTAASAPESVQDERAAQVWAGGAGASHWGGGCW